MLQARSWCFHWIWDFTTCLTVERKRPWSLRRECHVRAGVHDRPWGRRCILSFHMQRGRYVDRATGPEEVIWAMPSKLLKYEKHQRMASFVGSYVACMHSTAQYNTASISAQKLSIGKLTEKKYGLLLWRIRLARKACILLRLGPY